MWQKIKHIIVAPFKWIWQNLKDWRTFVIFIIVVLVISCEVWVPYIIGAIAFLVGNAALGGTMVGVATTCWMFWLLPGTPFLPLCIGITAGIKAIFNKIKNRKHK